MGPGVPAPHQVAGLRHKARHVADRSADHDVATLHRYSTPRGAIPFDYHHSTVSRGWGARRGVAPDANDSGHDVLGDAPSHVAVDGHGGLLVHAAHEIAGVPAYVH